MARRLKQNERAPASRPARTPSAGPSKGERTRSQLARTAFTLFEREGFERTTLRRIASEAGVSLGLLYRYYPSKDALVIELYDELSREFVARAQALPAGGWPSRVVRLFRLSVEVLEPHREALRAMISSLTVPPGHPLFIPGGRPSQQRVQAAFEEAVAGASDAPPDARQLGARLYLAHLGVVLAWLLDRSPAQEATHSALALLERFAPIAAVFGSGTLASAASPAGELLELAVLGKRGNG